MKPIVVLHYKNVLPQNWSLMHAAAKKRQLDLTTWEPHKIHFLCTDKACLPLYESKAVQPSAILHRTIFPFSAIVLPALTYWMSQGVVVLNKPAPAFASRDKLQTTFALVNAQLPVVPTVGFVTPDTKSLLQLSKKKILTKPAYGVRGKGITVFASPQKAVDGLIDHDPYKSLLPQEHFLAQPFLETGGRDLRAFVVDGRCIGLIERQAPPGEIRANLAHGARGKALALSHPASTLAVAALSACQLDYGGVDMIEDTDGTIRVLEVDAWAGFAGITKVTGKDVAGAILDLLSKRLKGDTK